MRELPVREIECFLVLADELHFGRTAERMFLSQSRVSQLISAFERRIGGQLVARTSRRVRLTPLGADLLASLGPAHRALVDVVDEAQVRARDLPTPFTVGFQGVVYASVARAISVFGLRDPRASVQMRELPLGDPFGDVLAGRVDVAVVLLPVEEPDLVTGLVFSRQPQVLAVSADHPVAARDEITAEELADVSLVPVTGPAPEYWARVHSPTATPGGATIRTQGGASTVQEGLSQVASSHCGLLLCAATAAHSQRSDLRFVPVTGLPSSALGLVWRADHESPRVRHFAETVEESLDQHWHDQHWHDQH